MTDEHVDRANRLADVGVELGGLRRELERQKQQGAPVGRWIPIVERLSGELQKRVAALAGRRLYNVTLAYEGIVAEDEEEAIQEAEAGYGPLVERRARLTYDPAELEDSADVRVVEEQPPKPTLSPGDGAPTVDLESFLPLLDEVALDPATGETVLPDYVLISHELYESIVPSQAVRMHQPRDELPFFNFTLRVLPRAELERIAGRETDLIAFDRRRTLEETVEEWAGPDDAWEGAVQGIIEP